jgi:hypothetical protein
VAARPLSDGYEDFLGKEATQMGRKPHAPHVDMQTVTDDMAGIYEAVATLEYSGLEPSRTALADATELPDPVLDENLSAMSRLGLLIKQDRGGEAVYVPAQRGWSAKPDQAMGPKLT